MCWIVVILVSLQVTPAAEAGQVATPGGDIAYPAPDDPAREWIASFEVVDDPHGLTIGLTAEGLAWAGTCDGAAALAAQVVTLYDRLPDTTGSIAWAEERMTQEIYGHGRAAVGDIPMPNATERANPIDIVFAHYTDPLLALTDVDAWAFQRGYATLYRIDCAS